METHWKWKDLRCDLRRNRDESGWKWGPRFFFEPEERQFNLRREAKELGLTLEELRELHDGDDEVEDSNVSDDDDDDKQGYNFELKIERATSRARSSMTAIAKQQQHLLRATIVRPVAGVRRMTRAIVQSEILNKARREDAAKVIQSSARSYIARRRLREAVQAKLKEEQLLRKMTNYALKIQRIFRGKQCQRLVRVMLRRSRMATRIQAVFRGFLERREKNRILEAKLKGQVVWRENEKHRGWMGRYAKRAADAAWEEAAHRATALLIRHVRGRLARALVERMRRDKYAASVIQRNVRGFQARNPEKLRLLRFNKSSKQTRRRLVDLVVHR